MVSLLLRKTCGYAPSIALASQGANPGCCAFAADQPSREDQSFTLACTKVTKVRLFLSATSAEARWDKMVYRIIGEPLERAEQLMRKKGMNKDAETFARTDALTATHLRALCNGRRCPGEHRPGRPWSCEPGHDHPLYERRQR